MGGRRPAYAGLLGLLVLALLASCSWIPTSGEPRKGRDLRLNRDDAALRVIGQEPVRGAGPVDVVSGFLQASADFVDDNEAARRFLAPDARSEWSPAKGTSIYDLAAGFSVRRISRGRVRLQASEVGRIDAEGRYLRSPAGTTVTRTFRMARVSGEWRISKLDDGLVLNERVIPVTYRQVNLYFLAPSRSVLVPDQVFLPALPGLASKLVARLLSSPTTPLRGAVTTGFPQGSELSVSSVPVRDGVAEVNLDASVLRADARARRQLSAQLVWTLKQLPEVQAIRILVEGEGLGVPGYGGEQPADAWPGFDPAGISSTSAAFAVRDGRVGQLVNSEFSFVGGAAGAEGAALRTPAVSADFARLAAVSADGGTLVTGRLGSPSALRPVLRGGDLSAPSWDPDGGLWVVDRADGRVWTTLAGNDEPIAVDLPRLPGNRVSTLRVSRDGARVALIVTDGVASRLMVGAIVRQPDEPSVRLNALGEVLPELQGVRDVSWSDATTVAVLGALDEEPVGPLLTDVSGYAVTPIVPLRELATVTAAPPSRPVVAGTAGGRLQQYTFGAGWVSLGEGADPAYPG